MTDTEVYNESMIALPTTEQVKAEIKNIKYRKRYQSVLISTIASLTVVAAIAVLVATIWLPVLQIYGSSMTPTLQDGDVVVSIKNSDFGTGDLVAFYLGNKILIKRCIAVAGDYVNIDEDGNVYVNGNLLDEPYLDEKALGDCDLEFPYQVPESRYFMLGDDRATSVDSRSNAIGCVADEQIVGKIVCRVWPLNAVGTVK
jgi:signal peptidase I